MDLKLILAALAILGLLGYLILGSQSISMDGGGVASSQPPTIHEIEFPEEITADGAEVDGSVHFSDPNGDLVEARFEVEAGLFQPFSIDLRGVADGITSGAIPFYLQTGIEQSVTLRVILVDSEGNESEPAQVSFTAFPVAEDEL